MKHRLDSRHGLLERARARGRAACRGGDSGAARAALLIAPFVILLACGGGGSSGPGAQPPGEPEPAVTEVAPQPSPGEPAGGENSPQPVTSKYSPTQKECEASLDHFLLLARKEYDKTASPELAAIKEDVAKVRAVLAPDYIAACQRLDRATHECEMKAESLEALQACSPPAQ